MTPKDQIRTWTREVGNAIYTYSTDPSLVDLAALNTALASDTVWWGRDMPEESLKRMVEHSYNFGLYVTEKGDSEQEKDNPKQQQQQMVGFARLITDYVTFGYLTDVYVLPEYQGKGLGGWMMECLNEALDQWPELRRAVLFTGDAYAAKLYERTLGMRDTRENGGKLMVMQRTGPAAAARMEGKKD
ncbi:acyl-CoA N-acyltransferase [Pseudoneurospora amorphoporcata]|uniref:Acyl-CoA N-acyltransferase n=1 Tax=Pseudoneurospora amorphoporcata TaxID=241081 RepID=A0AAN6NR09_9PEZI|nr:acyl-CoA N-acyltransferase [Pseudoneurospora amorphoporcata]